MCTEGPHMAKLCDGAPRGAELDRPDPR